MSCGNVLVKGAFPVRFERLIFALFCVTLLLPHASRLLCCGCVRALVREQERLELAANSRRRERKSLRTKLKSTKTAPWLETLERDFLLQSSIASQLALQPHKSLIEVGEHLPQK